MALPLDLSTWRVKPFKLVAFPSAYQQTMHKIFCRTTCPTKPYSMTSAVRSYLFARPSYRMRWSLMRTCTPYALLVDCHVLWQMSTRLMCTDGTVSQCFTRGTKHLSTYFSISFTSSPGAAWQSVNIRAPQQRCCTCWYLQLWSDPLQLCRHLDYTWPCIQPHGLTWRCRFSLS